MGKGMLKYMKTNQRLPESQSEISVGLKTGRTPVNSLIHREFLRLCAIQLCVCVYMCCLHTLCNSMLFIACLE